jgi:predicted nuclease with TOPRIM domain
MSAPVRHTCPNIDRMIKHLRAAVSSASHGKRDFKGEESYSYFDNILDEIDGLESDLEDLRSDNDALRKWGHELEDYVKQLESEIENLQTQEP